MKLLNNIRNKKPSIGQFSKCSDPAIIESMGLAGFEFVIIDMEHGPNSFETAQNLIRAATIHQMTPIVRIEQNSEALISKALDIGAQGIQIPQINDAEEAKNAVRAAKFSPLGNRGVCRYVRAAKYSKEDKYSYFEESNKNNLIIIQIEGEEGIKNIKEILKIKDIDIIFIGPYDLSQSLGVSGQTNHPKVVEAMKDVIMKANSYNKIVGTFVETPEEVKIWREVGLLYFAYKVDIGIFYDACYHTYNILKQHIYY